MNRILLGAVAGLMLALGPMGTANAVTDGVTDGDLHPAVGLLVLDVKGAPAWRCSGTLLSPTVMVTAGHCTFGATGGRVWFEADVQAGIPANGYPDGKAAGDTSVDICAIHTHPEYNDGAFVLHDVGVVELCSPVDLPVEEYGVLPSVNQLDALKTRRGKQDVTFTAVGYGLQKSFPDAVAWKNQALKVRMVSYPRLLQINTPGFTGTFSMLLSNNAATGGTCFGDSGGPNFIGDSNVIAGVTSFGLNGNCAGTGGVFRLDRADVLAFINQYL